MPAVATEGGLPTHLGKYEIVTPLASGGMARIYVARATGIGSFERHVVLKMILPERAHDATAVQMFLDEARLAASLNHQNVAQVFEVGEDAGIHYLAMEYVHGQDLRALLARAGSVGTRVPLELALTISAGAAAGLHHAHERRTSDGTPMGIVHRDVSPSNIMVGYDGSVKLLDFGIAKATLRSVETQSGIIKGKFAYMAPEQCRGRDVDRRGDVFSLGIILYEVTTQHRCFRADNDFDTMHRIVIGDVVRPSRVVEGYPQALEAIVMKALALDPAQRYQSAGLLLEAIESFALGERLSLSTMALGRFMRDTYGEVEEPWLASGRISQPAAAKEHTISNTNATGDEPVRTPVPVRPPSAPAMAAPVQAVAAQAGHHDEAPMHLPVDLQVLAAGPTSDGRSLPSMPVASPYHTVAPPPAGLAGGSQPIPPPRFEAAALRAPQGTHPPGPLRGYSGAPGASSYSNLPSASSMPGASYGAPGAGYSGTAGASYSDTGGYGDASPSLVDASRPHELFDTGGSLRLSTAPRPLYVGLGFVLVGIIALLVMMIVNSGSDDVAAVTPQSPSAVAAGAPRAEPAIQPEPTAQPVPTTAAVTVARPAPPADIALKPSTAEAAAAQPEPSITIRVGSTPPGADVLLAGTPVGTTPLEIHVPKRKASFAMLTVHRARFVDVATMIDLSADYNNDVKLQSISDEPARPAPRPAPHDTRPRASSDANRPATPSVTAKKCQPPERMDPFDTSCGGKQCPACPRD